jgi:hypothetical protein
LLQRFDRILRLQAPRFVHFDLFAEANPLFLGATPSRAPRALSPIGYWESQWSFNPHPRDEVAARLDLPRPLELKRKPNLQNRVYASTLTSSIQPH